MGNIEDKLYELEQKSGLTFRAKQIAENVQKWANRQGIKQNALPVALVQQYAVATARWEQCEEGISKYGFLAKHPTTGNPIPSPYVKMSQQFCEQSRKHWEAINQIVNSARYPAVADRLYSSWEKRGS